MEKFIKKICSDIVKQYKQNKNVLGILLFGSVTKNKFDQHSDIDIYILLNRKGKFSRINFIKDKIRIDIILDTVKEALAFLKEDKLNVRRNTSHMLAKGKILYQTNNNLDRVIAKAKRNLTLRTKYNNDDILMHKYSIDDFWGEIQRDIKNQNYTAFGLDSQLLLNNIIELFLKLNGAFFRQPDEMFKTLSKLDKYFADKIENFYKATILETKKEILGDLVTYIYKKSHGPLPQKWSIE